MDDLVVKSKETYKGYEFTIAYSNKESKYAIYSNSTPLFFFTDYFKEELIQKVHDAIDFYEESKNK